MAKKKIEEIYKEMDELTHILERPGMWVGSVKEEQKQMFEQQARMFEQQIRMLEQQKKELQESMQE